MRLQILGPWVLAPLDAAGAAPSYLVSDQHTTCLLDCGAGTLPLLQSMNVLPHLDAIVISHMHHDHYMDLFPLANTLSKHSLRIKLFVPDFNGRSILTEISNVLFEGDNRFSKAFEIIEYGVKDELVVKGLHMTFQETIHSMTCYAPRITNGNKTIVYSADSEYFPEFSQFAQGADLLLCEATFLDPLPGHMTGEQAGTIAAEANVGRLVLTHLRDDMDVNEQNRQNACKVFLGTVDLAVPGAEYRI
ncbi:MBL fold metallo-hydrolase [Paenibacillus periandrae]|uniref:MBL fold metallo-hydrolase n=1 Tax=Paenibacillus periandrae TaxID=1761741 RepID=UPI001F09C827|nr:MBL fold metallo-hydrolase [Paenibacillus periandrae]